MNVMFSGFWDLDEDASDKLEDIEGALVKKVVSTKVTQSRIGLRT